MHTIDGRITIGVQGEPVTLTSGIDERYGIVSPKVRTLVLHAPSGNTGDLRIGGQWVSAASGAEAGLLLAANRTEQLEDVCLDSLWVDGTAGDVVTFVAFSDTRRVL